MGKSAQSASSAPTGPSPLIQAQLATAQAGTNASQPAHRYIPPMAHLDFRARIGFPRFDDSVVRVG